MTKTLPHTSPDDERAGGETMFAGLAIPYMLAALMICLGLLVGGTFGFIVAFGSLILLAVGVLVGFVNFMSSDEEEHDE